MRVSLNQIKKFIDFELPPVGELVPKINQQLGGVEEVIDLHVQYKDVVIVRVVTSERHPDADKLHITTIDDGGVVDGVPRDEEGYVQVVCGAPNVRTGMYAVWLPPGATVPASLSEGEEPFVLDARKLRGVLSQGMLAAADELAIGTDHTGILEVTAEDILNGTTLSPGIGFARTFELDDTVIDIENKMFTHRPDLFGQLGVARELSAIVKGVTDAQEPRGDTQFENPHWYDKKPEFSHGNSELPLNVFNTAESNAPRFMAVSMDNIQVRQSPIWLRCALVAMGSKPVNNIVDITNYVMLITSQPVHAYDYDKLADSTIGVRMANDGEVVELLNGKTYELTSGDTVVVDGQEVVGLGGIMGSQGSQVTIDTERIVLECANFDMYTLRKSSMRHGIFTDALTRFNKGQSVLQNDRVMNYMMQLMVDVSGATQAGKVYDEQTNGLDDRADIAASVEFINERLGSSLNDNQISNLLQRTNFSINSGSNTTFKAPFWRTDIFLPEDIVEEVGRLYGFDKLPRELPLRRAEPTAINETIEAKRHLRHNLAKYGANETLGYSFVHGRTIQSAGQNTENAYRVKNALSPDLQYYRLSVLPSLLGKIHANIKAGHDTFALFEIGKYHDKLNIPVDKEGIPEERSSCDIVYAAKDEDKTAPFYAMKQLVVDVLSDMNIGLRIEPYTVDDKSEDPRISAFEPKRLVKIYDEETGLFIGYIGEIKQSVKKAFKLPVRVAAASLDVDPLVQLSSSPLDVYRPLSKYPSVERDITLAVDVNESYSTVVETIKNTHSNDSVVLDLAPVSIYMPENSEIKNITLHIKLTPKHNTLDGNQASEIMQSLSDAVTSHLDAKVI